MELTDIRQKIDSIDDELIRLFAERMDCARAVAEVKQHGAIPIRDRGREREIVNRLTEAAGDAYAPYVKSLYSHIFDLSRSYQSSLSDRRGALSEMIERALRETPGRALPAHALVACQGAEGGDVFTDGNNHGGALGGITSGMPLVVRAAFKPTPSIALEQASVSLGRGEDAPLRVQGRHDPCIVPRAVPVVEAAVACVMMDMIMEDQTWK